MSTGILLTVLNGLSVCRWRVSSTAIQYGTEVRVGRTEYDSKFSQFVGGPSIIISGGSHLVAVISCQINTAVD